MATIKQKKAIAHIIEGDSVSKAMLKAGYSPATAKDPKKLTESPIFLKVLEKAGVTDEKLAERLNEGLDATFKGSPDYNVRHKYLETGLRVKGHTKETPNINFVMPVVKIIDGRTGNLNTE